jgi:hypothetical protein
MQTAKPRKKDPAGTCRVSQQGAGGTPPAWRSSAKITANGCAGRFLRTLGQPPQVLLRNAGLANALAAE